MQNIAMDNLPLTETSEPSWGLFVFITKPEFIRLWLLNRQKGHMRKNTGIQMNCEANT